MSARSLHDTVIILILKREFLAWDYDLGRKITMIPNAYAMIEICDPQGHSEMPYLVRKGAVRKMGSSLGYWQQHVGRGVEIRHVPKESSLLKILEVV
jgi:hypothetical protein